MPYIEIVEGPTAGETFTARTFLDFMRKSHPNWLEESSYPEDYPWVFRGHWDADWKLVPTAARNDLSSMPAFLEVLNSIKKDISLHLKNIRETLNDNQIDQLGRCWTSWLLVERFLGLARELEFIDFRPKEKPRIEHSIQEFIECLNDIESGKENLCINRNPYDIFSFYSHSFDKIALAQHHGIPTFILDWTEDPLIACYFASNAPVSLKANRPLAVWAMHNKFLNKDLPKPSKLGLIEVNGIDLSRSNNKFLSSQSGLFTHIDQVCHYWRESGVFPCLETIAEKYNNEWLTNLVKNKPDDEFGEDETRDSVLSKISEVFPSNIVYLKKVILGPEEVPEFRRLLMLEGLSRAHLMPTFDNIAKTAIDSIVSRL